MKTYKLICSDIDGTLLNSNRSVSEFTIQTVKALRDKLPFVLISARMPKAMRHIQQDLGIENSPMVCYNGGLILHGNQVLGSTVISQEIAKKVSQIVLEKDLHFGIYHQDEWFVSKQDQWAEREENNTKVAPVLKSPDEVFSAWEKENKEAHKLMCMGDEEKVEQVFTALTEAFSNELHLYRSKPTYIEIAPKAISKLTGILSIADEVYQVKADEIVAYGDNYNDVELLKGVGLGVAVANAVEPVKAVAKVETTEGKQDGVAKHLVQLFQL
ncbi:HAD family hydrolase [Psychroflexus planctonicus]|uniref:Cof subfamily of IIB subfamily of haloacid dehalogenase superfamily/HAD-superfamily hydrolase, subfamily IIB n=1 Tax=Psychroflexus planctonicus TaxID=1526575 RepID=A0ABQ1SEB9_9FLAO|nr:HAD family hydrolase [Psychroflexus planctonicus]GGE23508.1 hypothetical protein GCM10010832_00240 [Psychroflexus planctonicus]